MSVFGNIKTGADLATACLEVAKKYKTLYITGCFGWPMNDANKKRIKNEWSANRQEPRATNIDKASIDTFGFDCVNLIKALLWGWCGDTTKEYGGAKYQSNGVPDIDEGTMFSQCKDQSTDFSNIEIGEAVWMQGHIGIYVGSGLVVECTPAWTNNVQITACNRTIAGYNRRNWTKHGKLPYVSYTGKDDDSIKPVTPAPEKDDYYRIRKSWDDAKSQIGAYKNVDSAIAHCKSAGNEYKVYDPEGKQVYPEVKPTPAPTPVSSGYYRVRKSWEDTKSQIGAYTNIDGAIAHCKSAGADYKVYDPEGKQVYPEAKFEPYLARVIANTLNVRKGPGKNYAAVNVIKKGGAYTIVEEADGWGLLKAYANNRDGWVSLEYMKRV